jgi:DegV family protein with EDD domain
MGEYVIITDSSCDMPASLAGSLGVDAAPLTVSMGKDEYKNYLDEREITFADFYKRLRAGENAVTSAANEGEFVARFTPILEAGKDILYIGFSSALSSTYQNGFLAANDLKEKYPDRKIFCIDSKCASMGQGLLVYLTAKEKEKGASFEEACDFAAKTAPRICHWFTVDDLFFLKRGGRVSAATAVVGSMLNIKPVLHVDDEGRLINMSTARGRKGSIKAIFAKVKDTSDDIANQTVFISHGDCIDDAKYLESMIRELGVKDVVINHVGPVIGAHSGPGTLAVFFLGPVR